MSDSHCSRRHGRLTSDNGTAISSRLSDGGQSGVPVQFAEANDADDGDWVHQKQEAPALAKHIDQGANAQLHRRFCIT